MNRQTDILDDSDHAALLLATERLRRIAIGDDAKALLEAIALCVPAAAGLIGVVEFADKPSMTNTPLELPTPVLSSWMGTGQDQLQQALSPVVSSAPGDFWRDADRLPAELRDKLEVLQHLEGFNLGEGAGYKVHQEILPDGSSKHVMMALITERGGHFPFYSWARLKALAPAVNDAFSRLGLPLIASRSILGQIMADENTGYVCLDKHGNVRELNQRGHDLASKYRNAAGIPSSRQFLQDFIDQARKKPQNGWHLVHSNRSNFLDLRMTPLKQETHEIPYDMYLLRMNEAMIPGLNLEAESSKPLALEVLSEMLTPRELEVAMLLARSCMSYKQIAGHIRVEDGTMRKHTENIYRKLGIHSRPELVALLRGGDVE